MEKKKIAKIVQKKLRATLARSFQRPHSVSTRSPHGICWPHSGGKEDTFMWQSTGWPASGKNIPRDVQKVFTRLKSL